MNKKGVPVPKLDRWQTTEYPKSKRLELGKKALNVFQDQVDKVHRMFGQKGYGDLMRIAEHDDLTRALSREGIYNALHSIIESTNVNEFMAVYLDVKGLRDVNNTYTHGVGDKYLHVASWGTRNLFKLPEDVGALTDHSSLVARWGGDEFLALLPANRSFDEGYDNLFSYRVEGCSEERHDRNIASLDIESLLSYDCGYELPASVRESARELMNKDIKHIVYAYSVGSLSVGDTESGEFISPETAIDRFMTENGSKYVR